MSQEESEGWETASEPIDQGDQENTETELSFSKKSPEEVESDAAATRSRTSSISSQLGRLSISGLTSLPLQSTSQRSQASNSPERPSNDPQYEHTRPTTSPVLEHHDSTSPMRKRGPGVPRNPVSDTWRDDAYTKKDSGKGRMVDVAKRQDRWRCEYCGRYNERGIAKDTSRAKIEGVDENSLVGVPGPSRPSPHAAHQPIQIPGSIPPGVAPGEVVKCEHCGDQMFLELFRYDPREVSEDGVRWNAVNEPGTIKALRREVARGTALRRVQERWREEERRKNTKEGRADVGGKVREGAEEGAAGEASGQRQEDEAETPATQGEAENPTTQDQGEDAEWEDEE